MLQRRRWERHRIALDVVVRLGDDVVSCRTSDLCEGGLGLIAPRPLDAGAELRFEVAAITATPLPGTVRWCTPGSAGFQIGVELTDLTDRQLDDLRSAIEKSFVPSTVADGR